MYKRIGMIPVVIMTLILLVGCQKTVINKGQGSVVTTIVQEEADAGASQKEEVKGFCMGIVTEITNNTIKIAVFSADQAGSTMNEALPTPDKSDKENDSKVKDEKPYKLEMTEEELELQLTDQTKVQIDNFEDSKEAEREDIALNSAVCIKYDTTTMEATLVIIKVI